ncbi:hypothetical protein PU629_02040 [Pullulanibacillus sp. KACC 23026]|uniref:hypothetical protein n=1 Tax=Pullulanibacillus sp. KACC 23026 TaxID=3028315 RepID=UPI0023AEC4B1|nr:hypothetical protein [Pullulanibacillus sp. KACC 23026]WEG13165.1 hypothetical protein PU629_02040 [Pullulanibacillus sp. KACC 23026]
MLKMKTKKNDVITYARPSRNALVVNRYPKGTELTLYPSVKGWYELRPVDFDGIMNTEFIRAEDVGIESRFQLFTKKLKGFTKSRLAGHH